MKIKKSKVYNKLLIVNTLIIVFLIGSFDIYFWGKISESKRENVLSVNDRIIYDVNDELRSFELSANSVVNNMYRDYEFISDVTDFLNTNKVDYLKTKLDKFTISDKSYYKGIEYFTKSSFETNKSLSCIEFVSYKQNESNSFNRRNQISTKKLDSIEEYKNSKNVIINKENHSIAYVKEIRNPMTLDIEGNIILTYDLNQIEKIIDKYDKNYEVNLLGENGEIKYNSNNNYEEDFYDGFKALSIGKRQKSLDGKYYINTMVNNEVTILGQSKKEYVNKLSIGFYLSLILINIFILIVGEFLLYSRFKKLNHRLNLILVAMDEVKSGNINISIPIGNEQDEINFISQNFNEMCKRLDEYITKSYLAELKEKEAQINQKKAEMMALQSQINPHFLYNTLESIRMKAICNGDKEVGKMIYILAFLFRSQLKEKNIISIKSELEYCKKYLEIFKFRYEDKFNFSINCEDKILEKQIIKFTIQPLIENYFVHGIRLENKDNEISINIFKNEDVINIVITDNGRGIEKDKLEELNTLLAERNISGKSIGITNANERIAIEYGESYGIKLEENIEIGTKIIVRIPCKEVL